MSAYRILQEALTNVLNHAGRVATRVRVERSPTELALEVRNDPPPPPTVAARDPSTRRCPPSSPRDPLDGGRGLLGMRERVAADRGTLDAGPLPGGGFSLRARIPLA